MSTHAELRHVKLSGAAVLEEGMILDRLNQHSALQRLFLLGGDHELAQPVRPRLGPRKHARRQLLCGDSGRGVSLRPAQDLERRPSILVLDSPYRKTNRSNPNTFGQLQSHLSLIE